eukprot:3849198-Rhodomonas_salina.1
MPPAPTTTGPAPPDTRPGPARFQVLSRARHSGFESHWQLPAASLRPEVRWQGSKGHVKRASP